MFTEVCLGSGFVSWFRAQMANTEPLPLKSFSYREKTTLWEKDMATQILRFGKCLRVNITAQIVIPSEIGSKRERSL